MRRIPVIEQLETHEQQSFICQCHLNQHRYPVLKLIFAVPNEGKRSVRVAARMKAEGMKPGVCDLALPVGRGGYLGWFGELKRTRTGYPSAEQNDFMHEIRREGYWAAWHRGAEEMWEDLMWYLSLSPTAQQPEAARAQRPLKEYPQVGREKAST